MPALLSPLTASRESRAPRPGDLVTDGPPRASSDAGRDAVVSNGLSTACQLLGFGPETTFASPIEFEHFAFQHSAFYRLGRASRSAFVTLMAHAIEKARSGDVDAAARYIQEMLALK